MASIAVETSRLAQALIRYCVENNVPVPRLDYGHGCARNLFIAICCRNRRGNPSGPKKELFVQLKKARLARKYDEFRTFHNFVLAVIEDI
ncbi:6645_t:CDS:2 [Entrophospora sp. SA101]|nr:6645_t:CDS:2 [Entrophospora sp. SA101]